MNRFKKMSLGFIGTAIATVAIDALVLERVFFKTKHFTLGKTSKKKPITILHITDLHFRKSMSLKYLRLVQKIEEINPDIILLSGDSIDQSGDTKPFEKFLRMLDSQIPIVAIPGNHDYKADINMTNFKKMFKKMGGDLLINETKIYEINGQRLAITGMDDMLNGDSNFEKAVADVGGEKNHLVLIHSPKHQEIIKNKISEINAKRPKNQQLNIFTFLAGHNHGGQVKLGPITPVLPPRSGNYVEGWYNDEKPYLYLSKGFGTSSMPVRFFARAEITVFKYFTES